MSSNTLVRSFYSKYAPSVGLEMFTATKLLLELVTKSVLIFMFIPLTINMSQSLAQIWE